MDSKRQIESCISCNHSSACFKKLLDSELDFVSHNKVQIEYKKGETICKKGDFDTSVFYILDGLVKVSLEGPGDKLLTVIILKAKEFIGLASLESSFTYEYTATALTPTTLCSIRKESFRQLIKQNGDFASDIVNWYCKNMSHLFRRLSALGFKHVNGKVADVLLYLNQEEFSSYDIFKILIRRDMANMAGIPVESLIRILSDFANDGLIEIDKKNIKILSSERLREISNWG